MLLLHKLELLSVLILLLLIRANVSEDSANGVSDRESRQIDVLPADVLLTQPCALELILTG